jgi:hypothetical protein
VSNYRVPIGPDGSVLHYGGSPSVWNGERYVERTGWRDNEVFIARLTISSVQSGRSAKYFIWTDADGRTFPMFAKDMVDLLRYATVEDGGVVYAQWCVRKRGSNYGIAYYEAV